MKYLRLFFTLATMIILLCGSAYAHKVTVFAWIEDGVVHSQSKFSGGRKVKGGKIEVLDHLNKKLLEGTTDDQGYFSFPVPPSAQTLKIVLVAGMGHTNHWQITAEELGTEPARQQPLPAGPAPASKDFVQTGAQDLERIVERAVEKQLAPLRAQLAEQSWGLRDIVAGLGYILGLMGLASYLHYRKATKTKK